MSLNFYSEIDSLQVTNKDEVVIKIKTSGSNLDKQIDELRTLNEARMQYAPMARVWFEESNKQRKAE